MGLVSLCPQAMVLICNKQFLDILLLLLFPPCILNLDQLLDES